MSDINNEVYDNPWTFDGDIFTSGDIKDYYGCLLYTSPSPRDRG